MGMYTLWFKVAPGGEEKSLYSTSTMPHFSVNDLIDTSAWGGLDDRVWIPLPGGPKCRIAAVEHKITWSGEVGADEFQHNVIITVTPVQGSTVG